MKQCLFATTMTVMAQWWRCHQHSTPCRSCSVGKSCRKARYIHGCQWCGASQVQISAELGRWSPVMFRLFWYSLKSYPTWNDDSSWPLAVTSPCGAPNYLVKFVYNNNFTGGYDGLLRYIKSWYIYTGWRYTYPSEKYEFFSSDHYSQYMESHKSHVPNHQPV